jgi:pimeloyl-ACP methyl ester carboxylesterase
MYNKIERIIFMRIAVYFFVSMLTVSCATTPPKGELLPTPKTYYRTAQVLGKTIFYREAGDPRATTIVLLHGYPSSSHTYRELIPMLSRRYHVIAPDNLGSGYSERPDAKVYLYTFAKLTDHLEGLLSVLGLMRYVLYMQDFGAPVGFRLMARHPNQILGIVSQNANAYIEGLTAKRQEFFRKAHVDRSRERIDALFKLTSEDAIINGQYLRDVPAGRRDEMSPDSWTHDLRFLQTKSDRLIQVQLFQDYQTNIDQYPDWQSLMRKWKFPALVVWGKNDPAFIPSGAVAYLTDLPKAKLHLLEAGHFAVEEKATEIAGLVSQFMATLTSE